MTCIISCLQQISTCLRHTALCCFTPSSPAVQFRNSVAILRGTKDLRSGLEFTHNTLTISFWACLEVPRDEGQGSHVWFKKSNDSYWELCPIITLIWPTHFTSFSQLLETALSRCAPIINRKQFWAKFMNKTDSWQYSLCNYERNYVHYA